MSVIKARLRFRGGVFSHPVPDLGKHSALLVLSKSFVLQFVRVVYETSGGRFRGLGDSALLNRKSESQTFPSHYFQLR